MARPKNSGFIPTESDIEKIERLAGYGLTMEQISKVFNKSTDTFERLRKKDPELEAAINRGVRKANDAVAQTAYQMAISGKVPAMTMFWLKCRARWKEVTHHEHSGTLTLEKLVAGSYQPEIIEHKPSGNITRGSLEAPRQTDDIGGALHDDQKTLERSDAD